MTIFELGALGELIGAIAVVLTLVYLAIQVKYSKESLDANTAALDANRNLAHAAALVEHDRMFNDFFKMVVENPDLSELFVKIRDGEQLSEAESFRHNSWMNIAMRTNQTTYQSARAIGHERLMKYTLHALKTRNFQSLAAVDVWKSQLRERAVMLGLDEYVEVADKAAEEAFARAS